MFEYLLFLNTVHLYIVLHNYGLHSSFFLTFLRRVGDALCIPLYMFIVTIKSILFLFYLLCNRSRLLGDFHDALFLHSPFSLAACFYASLYAFNHWLFTSASLSPCLCPVFIHSPPTAVSGIFAGLVHKICCRPRRK